MRRTTLVSPGEPTSAGERGTLKLFFTYAPFAGATTAMLDEIKGAAGAGKDVLVADALSGQEASGAPFDVDRVLRRGPDLVAVGGLAQPNEDGARNHYRWQDVVELLHAGIDVYATLRVGELANERDRASIIANRHLDATVPDRLFYGAQQVEFVDIDPQELLTRCQSAGRDVPDLAVLRQLRLLALQCVSQYAAASSAAPAEGAAQAAPYAPRDRVVALVWPGESPTLALREAASLAGVVHAPLQALCVQREGRAHARRTEKRDEAMERLEQQVEAMGFDLVVLYGSDTADAVRDYVRAQGVSDVVMARRPLSFARRLLLPVMPSLTDRVGEGLLGVRVHVVSDDVPASQARAVVRRGVDELLDMRPLHVLSAFAAAFIAVCVATALLAAGAPAQAAFFVYLLATAAVALLTKAFLSSLLTAALGCGALSILTGPGVVPSAALGMPSFVSMVLSLVAVALLLTRETRAAARSRAREQHTQALYELSRNLLYAHGMVEVVDLSIDALARLFGRSVVFYTADPLASWPAPEAAEARHHRAVRAVSGDFDEREFDKLTERNIAHWVFVNGSAAGSGTHTSELSDIRYLPLVMDDEVMGVIGISARRAFRLGEDDFLEMVCGQILNALERQALSVSHLSDMRRLRAGEIRDDFMGHLIASVNQASGTIADITRLLLSQREPTEEYRDVLEQAISNESLRARIFMNQALADLGELPEEGTCDLRAVAMRAVERSRAGHGATMVELEPGDDVADVVADTALVEAATGMIIEAAMLFAPVGSLVEVSVREHPERITISVADERPDALAARPAAFSPQYDAERSRALVDLLADRAQVLDETEGPAAMVRALRVPAAACMVDGKVDQRRMARVDRVEYGLHVASLAAAAHGGEVKMRRRLGGGAVTTLSLPRG